MPDDTGPEQSVGSAIAVAFNPKIGHSFIDKTLPYLVSLITVVYGALVAANALPQAPWVTAVGMVLAALNGFFVRHTGAK